jgi:hypothetical protein
MTRMVTPDKSNTHDCINRVGEESANNLDSALSISNTSFVDNSIIPISTLIQLHNAGIRKLVPLMQDSQTANVYNSLIV